MESFLVAVNAVIPFLFTFRSGMECGNEADADAVPSPVLLIFLAVGILATEEILILTVPRIVKENPRRGVIIQAIYRSNFILFGMPLTMSIFGDAASSAAAMVITVVTSIYNITSVMILEMFRGEGKTSLKFLVVNLAKNPLLQGAFVGLLFFFMRIKLPGCLAEPIGAFANMTSPLALFILGGTMHFNAIGKNLKYLVPSLTIKLAILPAVMIAIAYWLGMRGLELFLWIFFLKSVGLI